MSLRYPLRYNLREIEHTKNTVQRGADLMTIFARNSLLAVFASLAASCLQITFPAFHLRNITYQAGTSAMREYDEEPKSPPRVFICTPLTASGPLRLNNDSSRRHSIRILT
jgi:hypothetical protein